MSFTKKKIERKKWRNGKGENEAWKFQMFFIYSQLLIDVISYSQCHSSTIFVCTVERKKKCDQDGRSKMGSG